MPRITFLSGISLLLTTAIFGQAPPLPRHPTQQQIIGYHLQQQREWNLRQLPTNSVLYRAVSKHNTSLSYSVGWKADDLPAYNTAYGFMIKPTPIGLPALKEDYYNYRNSPYLKNYLQREVPNLFGTPNRQDRETIGSLILREILFPSLSFPR